MTVSIVPERPGALSIVRLDRQSPVLRHRYKWKRIDEFGGLIGQRGAVCIFIPEHRNRLEPNGDESFGLLARIIRLGPLDRHRTEYVERVRALLDVPADLFPLTEPAGVIGAGGPAVDACEHGGDNLTMD